MDATDRQELAEARRKLGQAKSALDKAGWDHSTKVSYARSELRKAERARDKRLADLKRQAGEAAEAAIVKRAGGITLYGDRVEAGGETVPFAADTEARVDVSGGVYTTTETKSKNGVSIPGAIIGGVVAGPVGTVVGGVRRKTETINTVHDDRVIYFTVSGSAGGATWAVPLSAERDVRDLAARVKPLAASLDKRREESRARREEASKRLAAYTSDDTAIVKAREALAEAEADDGAVRLAEGRCEEAQAELAALAARINEAAVARGRRAPLRADGRQVVGKGAIVLAVIAFIVLCVAVSALSM